MTDTIKPSSSPKPRRRWLRWLAGLFAALIVLLLVAYLVVTSTGFFKSVVLPRVGAALHAGVTVSDASLHPFSGILLRDLKVQAAGQPPLISASEVRVSYHLFDLLHGNLHVDEIALVSPTVQLVVNPDGTSNLDPIMQALQTPPTTAPAAPKPSAPAAGASKPLQVDLGKLTLSHATILQTKNYANGGHDLMALTNVDVTLANLKNGQTAKLDLAADIRIENNSATNTAGLLAASLKGSLNCALDANLKPGSAGGSVNFAVSEAGGAFGNFDAFGAALDCEVTPAEIKQLALHFQKAGEPLGELAVTGPFDAAKMEGRLAVALHGIDRRLLSLVGAGSGLDFGGTQIDSTNVIELAKGGATITAAGRFTAAKVALTRAGQTTPTLDVSADYDVTVDRAAQSATLRSLNLAGTQNGAPLLSAQLTSPMNLAWGASAGGMGDAAFDLALTGLNLADWKPFLGDQVSAGKVGLKLNVSSHQAGKQIEFGLNTDVAGLAVRLGTNQITSVAVALDAHGQAAQFKQISLNDYKLQVALQNQPALTATGAGSFDVATGDADAQVKLTAALARLLQALPQPGMNISSGDVELNARVTQKQKNQTLAGDLSLANFSAQVGNNQFLGYATQLKLDVAVSPAQIQINQMTGSFSQNGNTGGSFDISGNYQPAPKTADVDVKFTGVNENALRPYLEPLLAGKKLVSVSLNGNVNAQYNPAASSAVKADVKVANLVVNDPAKKFPATPLAVGFQVDASLLKQTADIRQLRIALTPTALGSNQLQFSGQVDFSKTDAIQGNLKLAADSLDLTSYYDLFAGATNAAPKTVAPADAAPAAAAAPAANAGQEPAPVHLPLQNFTFAADIGKIYLHAVAVTTFQTTVKFDGGHVVLQPFQLALNGAPVTATADVDLGVPGYKYNITYDGQNVPLKPLVDTFQPARAGQMGGTLTSAAHLSGAGITGASLQKNLAGKFDLGITNLNLSVINVQSKILKSVINVVATIPELISNPANAIVSLLGGITGQGGLMKELQQAPIEVISVQATAGSGKINLTSATVQSAAFAADASGGIALNSVLTNSTINIPVKISLSQSIAQQLKVTDTTASTGNAYVPLPQFLTLSGTIGNPKTDINKLALVGLGVKSIGGSLLNPSGNNPSSVGGLLNQILRPH